MHSINQTINISNQERRQRAEDSVLITLLNVGAGKHNQWFSAPQALLSPTNKKIAHHKRELEEKGIIKWYKWYKYYPVDPETGEKPKGVCQQYWINWTEAQKYYDKLVPEITKENRIFPWLEMDKSYKDIIEETINEEYIRSKKREVSVEGDMIKIGYKEMKVATVRYVKTGKPYTFTAKSIKKIKTKVFAYGEEIYAANDEREIEAFIEGRIAETKWRAYQNVKAIEEGRHYMFSNISNRRAYNNISNLPRKLRKAIRIEGEEVGSIDLKNSQPTLLGIAIGSKKRTETIEKMRRSEAYRAVYVSGLPNDDIQNWIDDCGNGEFYEKRLIREGRDVDKNSRSESKEDTFRFLYGKPRDNGSNRRMGSVYPSIKAFADAYKNEFGYKQLAIDMQRIESEIFGEMKWILYQMGIKYLGLHDSIYVKKSDLPTLERVMHGVMSKYTSKYSFSYE